MDRGDRAIKMEWGGEGTISTLHARGREKMAGEGGEKKGGIPFFLFFFFSSPGWTRAEFKSAATRFISRARYRADFAPPRNFERSHANSAPLRRHDNDCGPVLGLTGP